MYEVDKLFNKDDRAEPSAEAWKGELQTVINGLTINEAAQIHTDQLNVWTGVSKNVLNSLRDWPYIRAMVTVTRGMDSLVKNRRNPKKNGLHKRLMASEIEYSEALRLVSLVRSFANSWTQTMFLIVAIGSVPATRSAWLARDRVRSTMLR